MILILCSAVGPRNLWFNKDDQCFWCKCLEGHTLRNSKSMLFHFKDGNWVQWGEMTCLEMKTWDLCSTVLFWPSVCSGPWVDIINQLWHQLTSQCSTLGSHLYPRLALGWDLVAPPPPPGYVKTAQLMGDGMGLNSNVLVFVFDSTISFTDLSLTSSIFIHI